MTDALSARQAGLLARRAAGPGGGMGGAGHGRGGLRGWLARRAWRRLLAAGNAGDRHAIDAVWQQWLRAPRPEALGALLWWRPDEVARDICALAMSPDASPATRERFAALCVEHGLAPADPVERVRFDLLTGQFDKVHDSDPDGVLVAEGYRTAGTAQRALLREALVADGDLDLPGILVGTNRAGGLGDDEVEHLAGHFAATGEWDRLWRLATELPVRAAIAVAHRFDGWRPGDPAGRALFDRLSRGDPDAIGRAERELRATSVRIATAMPDLRAAAFAPDGGSIVLACSDGMWQADLVRRFSLPDGVEVARWPVTLHEGALLDLGDVVVLEEQYSRFRLDELTPDGGSRTLFSQDTYQYGSIEHRSPVPAADGFVTSAVGAELLVGSGRPLSVRQIPALRMPPPRWSQCRPVAADPGSGRLAVHGHRSIAVLAPNRQPVAWTDDTRPIHDAAFLGPDHLVTADDRRLTRWEVSGRRLIPEATGADTGYLTHVTALGDRGQILAVGPSGHGHRTRLMLFDASTLDPAGELPALFDRRAWCVWASQDGGRIVFSDRDRTAHVHDVVAESVLDALTRPAVRLGPLDAQRLADARRRATDGTGGQAWRRRYGPAVHEAFAVLDAVLRYRLET